MLNKEKRMNLCGMNIYYYSEIGLRVEKEVNSER